MFIFRRSLSARLLAAQDKLAAIRSDALTQSDALDDAIEQLIAQRNEADDVVFAVDDMLQDADDDDEPSIINLAESEGF